MKVLGLSVAQYIKKIKNKRTFKTSDAQKVLESLVENEKKSRGQCYRLVIDNSTKLIVRNLLNFSYQKLDNGSLQFINKEAEVFSGHLPAKRKRIDVQYESDLDTTLESSFVETDLDESFTESREKQLERENEELKIQLKRAQIEMNIAKSRADLFARGPKNKYNRMIQAVMTDSAERGHCSKHVHEIFKSIAFHFDLQSQVPCASTIKSARDKIPTICDMQVLEFVEAAEWLTIGFDEISTSCLRSPPRALRTMKGT